MSCSLSVSLSLSLSPSSPQAHHFSLKYAKKKRAHKLRKGKKLAQPGDEDEEDDGGVRPNFAALLLVHDPQEFAERLFKAARKSRDVFEVRVAMLNLVSRMIGSHDLVLLSFYSFLLKYMQPHQREVTKLMAISVQATHALVPPDVVRELIVGVANNFITHTSANAAITVGLNFIRSVCERQPLAMDADLLQDLTQYKGSRDKGVMASSRGLIGLFRRVNPDMLNKRDMGKIATMSRPDIVVRGYGETAVSTGVDGIELLQDYERRKANGEIESSDDDMSEDGDWEAYDGPLPGDDGGEFMALDSDEEGEGEAMDADVTPVGSRIDQTRILTTEDFKRIEKLKQEAQSSGPLTKLQRRQLEAERQAADQTEARDDTFDSETLLENTAKAKLTYAERRAHMLENRSDKRTFGFSHVHHDGTITGTTHREKQKANVQFARSKARTRLHQSTDRFLTRAQRNTVKRQFGGAVGKRGGVGKRKKTRRRLQNKHGR